MRFNRFSTAAGLIFASAVPASAQALPNIPALVNVNLQNVLNDLSVRLKIDRSNLPITVQLPITVAANVCGVSVNVLAVSTGGQAACSAKTGSPQLAQLVQQQMAAGGNVGGGAQGGSVGGGTGTASGSGTTGSGTMPPAPASTPTPQPAPTSTPPK